MQKISLFCKSFHEDVYRVRRLLESVQLYNKDNIPFYLSVPAKELKLFQETTAEFSCHLITDEEILEQGVVANGHPPADYPRNIMQQIVKLEFWRMDFCHNYFWLDSDSYFIRPFFTKDFFDAGGQPYNVQYEDGEIFDFAKKHGRKKIISDYNKMAQKFKEMFNRQGPFYLFGPSPLLWSCEVIKELNQDFFSKRTVYDFFREHACEINLYAEYLLSQKRFSFTPREPFFKVFHYPEQFYESQYLGEWDHSLAKDYMGVVIQSNWAKPDLKRMNKKTFKSRIKELFQRGCRS